ncbi:caspase family protein [Streptomyces sp. NBC_00287]|uniref:caspase, EACC1-associated type n=1 Tax=Streptomyces sp. NBC_00287 TaxID=2975702 RepID=UPI002E28FC06|nr:caspase family protein [Streptomyces sp. NBC_00287]
MKTRLPDPRGSRAVLIGTSSYDSPDLKPLLAVRNNLEVLSELLTADNGAFLPGRCTVVQDSADPRGVCRTIREAAADAPDTLLVYFSGHGILNHDYSELHLALSGADQNDLRWTTVPFQVIREIFETASCRNKILILDCCQSGWVLDSMMGDNSGEAPLEIRGTYLLTSSSGDLKSYAPPTDRYTAFTGELIQLLRDGLPGGPELLPLSALFDPLAEALEGRSMPRPQQQGSDGHAALALVRNRAVGEGEAVDRPVAVKDAGPVSMTRLRPQVWHRRLMEGAIVLPALFALLWVFARFGPKDGEPSGPGTPAGTVMIGVLAALILLFGTVGRVSPSGYSLAIGSDGIEVRYGKDHHFYYPWHRVSRVWVVARPGGRLRGPRYTLMLRPKPGVLIKTARRGAPGPSLDLGTGALRFARLTHLDSPPSVVERALSQAAGSAWTPSSGPLGQAPPDEDGAAVLSAERGFLVVAALFAALLAYLRFPKGALTDPIRLWLAVPSLFLSSVACAVLWLALARLVHPVRLVISAAGVTLTRAETEIVHAWTEIERIGIVHWRQGTDRIGLLVLRPVDRGARDPGDRGVRRLPRFGAGTVTLCAVPEVTLDPDELRSALARFAAPDQLAPPGNGWLKSTPAEPVPPDGGTTFEGRRSQGAAMALGALLVAPLVAFALSTDGRDVPMLLYALQDLVLAPLPLFGFAFYFLTGRHRVTLHVGAAGLTVTLSASRPRTLRIPWGDIESVGIIATQHPSTRHSLVMWLRPGARPPRFLWWPYRQEYGGLRLISLEGSRLDTSPEELDRALAHHAGGRHSRIQRLTHPSH